MSMMGQMYRVSALRLEELLANPTQIQAELYPGDYPANVVKHGEDVEKTWNAIEFTLDRLAEKGTIAWVAPLTEGEETGCVLHYGPVWCRTSEQVAEIANVLSQIARNDFRVGFMPDVMSEYNVYPDIWDEEDKDKLFEYVWQHYENMVRFYRAASDAGDAMLLHIA